MPCLSQAAALTPAVAASPRLQACRTPFATEWGSFQCHPDSPVGARALQDAVAVGNDTVAVSVTTTASDQIAPYPKGQQEVPARSFPSVIGRGFAGNPAPLVKIKPFNIENEEAGKPADYQIAMFDVFGSGTLEQLYQQTFPENGNSDVAAKYHGAFLNPLQLAGRYPRPAVLATYPWMHELLTLQQMLNF